MQRKVIYLSIASCVQRSVAKVEWSTGGLVNIYRVGHKGKVMVQRMVFMVIKRLRYVFAVICFCLYMCRWIFAAPQLVVVETVSLNNWPL